MAPSNANTSGLVEKLLERARVSTDPLLAMYASQASKQLVTAASAQARNAELEARVAELESAKWEVKHVDTMNDMVAMGLARDAAESRADRLAKALERIAYTPSGMAGLSLSDCISEARAALQQETQP